MKKLTILLATIATLFSTTLFTSCSEPESNEPTIVGTWVYEESEEDFTGRMTFVFNADGSGSVTQQYIEGSASSQMSENFEYVYNKDTRDLFLISGSASSDFEFFDGGDCKFEATITANKLKLTLFYYDSDDGGVWVSEGSITFTRK